MDKSYPLISIITVVFNNKVDLLKTINSIRSLDYPALEYIIIDGDSKDGTLELIKNNSDVITKFISEKDSGLYDAMNKGIGLSTGKYIWFINAGDMPYDNRILKKVFETETDADFYYGDIDLIDEDGKSYGTRTLKTPPEKLSWKKLIDGMVVSHQSMIVKKSIVPDYDLNYRYVADIDWAIRVLKNAEKIVNTHLILSKFQIGGFSRKNNIPSLKERFKVLCKHFNIMYVILNHFKLLNKFVIHAIRRKKLL